jgi:hypothetical protein
MAGKLTLRRKTANINWKRSSTFKIDAQKMELYHELMNCSFLELKRDLR